KDRVLVRASEDPPRVPPELAPVLHELQDVIPEKALVASIVIFDQVLRALQDQIRRQVLARLRESPLSAGRGVQDPTDVRAPPG
ncbi:hypothetical protein L6R50_26120, partial [Myxococcota bacterium]|nr:hypothetical protein [Myxococcota bacterium]